MTKRRAFKRWIAGLSALVMLLTIGLALPVGARAEKNTVRVLLTRLNLTDRLEIALDGSYTLDGMSFQRGSRLVLSCATGRIMVYYEGMALDSGKELVLTRHQAAEGLENGLRLNGDYALYRGDLHVKTDGKMLTAVLHIPIEEYLLGVVPYEMSDSFPLEALKAQYPDIIPILSPASASTDTRFGTAAHFRSRLESICGHDVWDTIAQVEPIGPKKLLDALIVAPATGNTLAKLACGIADTPVTLAVKAHLRNERPVILAVSSNDALAANAESIGRLLARRHHYFVPMRQDAPHKKPRSVVADFSLLPQTVEAALRGEQLQPILL